MKTAIALLVLLTHSVPSLAADRVRIAVMGLFHPQRLVIEPVQSRVLIVNTDQGQFLLGNGATTQAVVIRSERKLIVESGAERLLTTQVRVTARQGEAEFLLSVPGKLRRLYRGQLAVSADGAELQAVIGMDVETAVASIVAAELPADTPIEALKAQAVVTRSYLIAGGPRHPHADFCDTTHCQFLRRPPQWNSPAARAARATEGLVLLWRGKPFGAMYSASCGGRTRTAAEVGYPERGYPYFAVDCAYCRRSPERWSASLTREDAAALAGGERARVQAARRLGWNTVPSNGYSVKRNRNVLELNGAGRGHGMGLCQRGAAGMARDAMDFRSILAHYYPNTTIENFHNGQAR